MTMTGVKQGRTIVLDGELKLADGEKVLVEVERIELPEPVRIVGTSGDPEVDRQFMARIEELRRTMPPLPPPQPRPPGWKPGEGFRRSAGAWANCPEMDEVMAEIQRLRHGSARPEPEVQA